MKDADKKESTLSAEQKLHILEVVEARLEKLPAATYQIIDAMVAARVAQYEKMYRWIGAVVIAAVAVVSVAFYKVTADKAAETVAKELATTQVKNQVAMIDKLFTESQDTKNKLVTAAVEGLNASDSLKARLRELEKIDNIVRYAGAGTLLVTNLGIRGGGLTMYSADLHHATTFYFGTNDTFTMFDGKTFFEPFAGTFIMAEPTK